MLYTDTEILFLLKFEGIGIPNLFAITALFATVIPTVAAAAISSTSTEAALARLARPPVGLRRWA